MSPTEFNNPLFPWDITSGIPPESLAITGTPQAIASRADKPKLSLEDGKINKSEIFRTSLVDFRLPKKENIFTEFRISRYLF